MGDDDLDLLGLKEFSFEPEWGSRPRKYGDEHSGSGGFSSDFEDERGERKGKGRKRFEDRDRSRDRKGPKDGAYWGQRSSSPDRGNASHPGGFNRRRDFGERPHHDRQNFRKNQRFDGKPREFIPIVEAGFYPEDSYFSTAIAAFRLTCKTYELFNVARLFLEKPERFVVVVKKTASQEDKNLYMAVDSGFVFADEQSLVRHILANHIDKYFDIGEEDIGAPSGTFICIHKCGLTGKLLCPPNYHRYQEILTEHHDENFPRMPFHRFKEKIESIADQGAIDEWKANVSKTKVYVPKIEGTGERFTRLSDAKKFFIEHFRDQAMKVADSFRITGVTFNAMPRSILGKSIFTLLLREKKFPLGLANNLRSKLRHENFTIYKIGPTSKIAYICAVKRKFRSAEDRFEDDIQRVVDCIDASPNCKPADVYQKLYPGAVIPDDAFSKKDENLSTFIKNLNWLIHEGYVAEFEDGRLVATAIVTKEQLKAMNSSESVAAPIDESASVQFNESEAELPPNDVTP
ncbi:MAG: hypothetical protein LBF42_03300 [Puniceicoccales bacterium]|jgi:hypothetical protein|nr:hypothetical protein [Puniceicoccales bacterium]